MQEKYKQLVEEPMLEQERKKLRDLRSLYKPIDQLGLNKHDREYQK